MKEMLAYIICFIVSIFLSYKLGEHNEKQNNVIDTQKKRAETVKRANDAGYAAVDKWVSKRK